MPSIRIALAQLNVTVGDLPGNRAKVAQAILRAKAWRADVVVVPELAITGYPPEDLLLKPRFVEDNLKAVQSLRGLTQGLTALVGFVDRDRRGRLSNAVAVFANGRQVATYHKQCLPNYGVFDEKRYFIAGEQALVLKLNGVRCGVTICEDLWETEPARVLANAGCQLVINLSASPYHAGKLKERQQLFAKRAQSNRVAIAYCNLIGGQDELVFDGASLILNARGRVLASGFQFKEDLVVADLVLGSARPATARATVVSVTPRPHALPPLKPTRRAPLDQIAEIYEALVLGTRDYVRKNTFEAVVLGLSGGIDSSLTACVAVEALGREHVVGVVMPSRFSSSETQDDARQLAQALGIRCAELSIEPCFRAYLDTLNELFGDHPSDVTEQNIQARIRGNLLMALSNKFGWLVLTTGNKSEMATGYCTLYGDMAGGFAIIKDVPKTLVYDLARFRNQQACLPRQTSGTGESRRRQGPGSPIPERVFQRAPTAELAPNQTDQDTLPPYDVLDPIVKAYVEEDQSVQDILQRLPAASTGNKRNGAAQAGNRMDAKMVKRVIQMVDRTEYKRRQGPPGIKITPKAFGKDRRMPITNRYHQG